MFRDPDRAIRLLYAKGFLKKIGKGVYRHDPDDVNPKTLRDFTPAQKEQIFKNDGYKCVYCGLGPDDGMEIHADHKIPREKGGESVVENGQTVCSVHNFRKKAYNLTESGKRFFIHLYKSAKKINDKKTMEFCKYELDGYDKFDINSHIEWNENK